MTTCGGGGFSWEAVVPRIVNPTKVRIIELLLIEQRPLSATRMERLIGDPETTVGRLHYHCETLVKAEVLKPVPAPVDAAHNERFYCLAVAS